MSSSTWQVHFKNKLAGFLPPSEGSALEQALLESRLSEEEYFAWVLKNDTAPLIRAEFFTDQTPSSGLLQKISGSWNPLLFPVSEWDGQFVVAGLERPAAALPPNCTFVYASPSAMAPWWTLLQTEEPPSEAPEGINQVSEPTKLSFAGIGVVSATPAVVAETSEEPIAATPKAPAKTEPMIATAKIAATPVATISKIEARETLIASKKAAAVINLPPDNDLLLSEIDVVAPVPTFTKNLGPLSVALDAQPHMLSTLGDSLKVEVTTALRSLQGLYEKTMFLALAEKKDVFYPLFWNEGFGKSTNAPSISSAGQSIFNLIFETEKPFHGPVSSSDLNDSFFKAWTSGESPGNATLVPFFYRGQLAGILLGFGSAELYRSTVLRQIETVCAELSHRLGGDAINNRNAA